jgi:hypothetical protein
MILYLDTSALVKRYCFDQRLAQAAREERLAT